MTNYYRRMQGRIIALNAILAILVVTPAFAQQSSTAPNAAPAGQTNTPGDHPGDKGKTDPKSDAPKQDRLFGVLPNYLTVEEVGNIPPIAPRTKYKLAALGSFDPVEFAFVGCISAIGQASNSDPGYGQGMSGYGKRYGDAFANQAIGNVMTGGLFPSLLHQDPRYFQLGKGSAWHRAWYAASRIPVTRTDSGGKQFNYSEFAGNAVTAAISNVYSTSQERTVSNTLTTWGTQIMWDTLANEAKEFWPDIRRRIHKK